MVESLVQSNLFSSVTASIDISTSKILNDALSDATRKAYATDWKIFTEFCTEHEYSNLPTNQKAIIDFVTQQSLANKALQTIRRRLAAIKFVHELKGYEISLSEKMVTLLLKGIARQQKNEKRQNKLPISVDLLTQMLNYCDPNTLIGKRDKALLLFGFAGAFRRSELCALKLDDLEETVDGLKVYLRSSKGDQFGKGQIVAMPYGRKLGVISALKTYLEASEIYDGYVFRSILKGQKKVSNQLTPLSVALIVKKYIKKVGKNPNDYAAHSMRSGFLTEAAENGANLFKMLEVSRHKSADTLLGYIKNSNLFQNHAGKDFL